MAPSWNSLLEKCWCFYFIPKRRGGLNHNDLTSLTLELSSFEAQETNGVKMNDHEDEYGLEK
jgi:hypothetical protein